MSYMTGCVNRFRVIRIKIETTERGIHGTANPRTSSNLDLSTQNQPLSRFLTLGDISTFTNKFLVE